MERSKDIRTFSVGPALVDVTFRLSDALFERIATYLNTKPGGWVHLENLNTVKHLFYIATGFEFPSSYSDFVFLHKEGKIKISAGSTNLGVFSALTNSQRQHSAIITAVGCDGNGNKDPLASLFSEYLHNLHITHYGIEKKGDNPLGMVFTSESQTNRILTMYPGVTNRLDRIPDLQSAYLFYFDAYELRQGSIAKTIDRVVQSKKFRVAIGLSNHGILVEKLLGKLRYYCQNKMVNILVGNEQEFISLCKTNETYLTLQSVPNLDIYKMVPNLLITLGDRGMFGISNGQVCFQPAQPSKEIVSTSGAGDVAAGVFISGLLEGERLPKILEEAALYASRVLRYEENILPDGRA